jgi:hypothetical protein
MTDQFIVRAWVTNMPQPIDYGPMNAENAQQLEGELLKKSKAITRPIFTGGRLTVKTNHVISVLVGPVPEGAQIGTVTNAIPGCPVSAMQIEEGHDSPEA